jgi:hypothetical protein
LLQPRTHEGSLCNPGYEVEIVTAMRDAKDFYGSAHAGLSIEDVQLSGVTTMGSDRENPGAPNTNGPDGGPQA